MPHGPAHRWAIRTTSDVRDWLRALRQTDPATYRSVNVAIDMLAEVGPGLGRPLVDTLRGSSIGNVVAEVAYDGWLAFERKRREG
ncbi:hypothetical protein ACIA3K_02985 [Micromonospora sp. NPDC051543]|uniref:hypothetical protein n=1 Tax=Micromonospora sp. NPDC051543 TaxID=3364287 RepID=UPI0037B0F69E